MVFANRIAAFLWGFALIWLALLVVFSLLLIRDGPPEGYSLQTSWAILALFWLGGTGLARYALSKPCYFVTVDRGGLVRFTWQYPHRRLRTEVPHRQLAPPRTVESEDDEGNPYFFARLDLPDGKSFRLAESHDRSVCEEACVRFADAIESLNAYPRS